MLYVPILFSILCVGNVFGGEILYGSGKISRSIKFGEAISLSEPKITNRQKGSGKFQAFS